MTACDPAERQRDGPSPPVRRGVLVLVVGPSGAGKDTLIRLARAHFAPADDVLFVRRAITRPEDRDGEGHLPMTPVEFDAAERDGRFAVHWHAHGLRYGIPAIVDAHVGSGGVAVANGSRAALPLFFARYLNLAVVHVTARHGRACRASGGASPGGRTSDPGAHESRRRCGPCRSACRRRDDRQFRRSRRRGGASRRRDPQGDRARGGLPRRLSCLAVRVRSRHFIR